MHAPSVTAPPLLLPGRRFAELIGIVVVAAVGCTQAPPPPSAPRPAVAARPHDHDHDHADDHGHAHGKASGKADDRDDHDDHEHPQTLAAGVAEIQSLWGKVRTAIGKGDRDTADEHVHEVGHLLEDFEGFLAAVPAESQEAGKKAVQEIFDCFDSLDTAFHGDEGDWKKVDLDALAPRLEAAFKTLSGLVSVNGK